MMPLQLQVEAMAADGRLWLLINGCRYYYELDAAHLIKFNRLMRWGRFGKALALVKGVKTYYEKLEVLK
jgi:hypothetical protein